MNICFLCKTNHKINCFECDKIISMLISNYQKINTKFLMEEIASLKKSNSKSKNKKYKCEFCEVYLSSLANYRNHTSTFKCKNKNKDINCDKCGNKFATKQNLKYHMSHNVCGGVNDKSINNCDNLDPNVSNISNVSNTTNNLTNSNNTANNNTNNIQNNIQINVNPDPIEMLPFRDVSYKIPTKKYLEYANNPDQAIKQFVKDYHLNPEKPDRMNVLNTNRRDNRVQLFDFDEDFICRWQTKDKSKVLELLCDRGVNALFFAKTMLAAAGIKLDPEKETALNAKIKEYESSDKVKKKYVDMIGDLTYDYRDVVESNKKKMDSQQKLIC
jgi:hypothetical protein